MMNIEKRYNLKEYSDSVEYLNDIFDHLNKSFFENALSKNKPLITIQSGAIRRTANWISGGVKRSEININAENLNRPFTELVALLIHEMIHLFNRNSGIQDTSRGGTYHNTKFKECAEAHGLTVCKDPKNGWMVTGLKQELIDWCLNSKYKQIDLFREVQQPAQPQVTPAAPGTPLKILPAVAAAPAPKKSSTRKLVCPTCGASVRATRNIKMICGACFDGKNLATIFYLKQA